MLSKILIRLFVLLAFVFLVAGGVTILQWRFSNIPPSTTIRESFERNNLDADSAPKQSVVAEWAIKDGIIAQTDQTAMVLRRLEALAFLQVAGVFLLFTLVGLEWWSGRLVPLRRGTERGEG